MKRGVVAGKAALTCLTLAALSGCMPKISVEKIREMKPVRAAELDRLNMFLGQWTTTGECESPVLEEKLSGTGVSTNQWECDNWVMAHRMEFEVSGLGESTEIQLWTWDMNAGKFRIWSHNSWGLTWTGSAKFDADAKTWRLKASGKNPMGHDVVMEGTIVMTDPNTMEWTWKEWSACKLMKMGEWKGTSKRKM